MKKILIFLCIALTTSACNEWLDVSPLGEVKEEDMYQNEEGFQGVLTGAYIAMASADLYGRTMTIQVPELLAQNWDVYSSTGLEANIRDYNFETTAARNQIAATWRAYYNAIVGLNSLLAAIDGKQDLFTHGNYALIKGEALGLRAFLHFDVLRLWGPAPLEANAAAPAIPYVEEVTREWESLVSLPYQVVLQKILADLNQAEELLQNDPITLYARSVLNNGSGGPADEFHYYRQNRFNLLAAKAAKARYYQWIGQPALAASCAREVVQAVVASTGKPVFELATEGTIAGGISSDGSPSTAADLVMSMEHIFALHNPHFSEIMEPFFNIGNCMQELSWIDAAYEKSYHSDDIRCKTNRYWEELQYPRRQAVFKKFYDPETRVSATVMPLIRLAEMYFIIMECGSIQEANERLIDFRVARVMDGSIDNSLADENDVRSRLEKEYRKEFYGEGQMFYYYKRHNVRPIAWPTVVENVAYTLPKPEQQNKFE
ncbi:MAG: RagB/SusD family nutrient uptake outer membrane protein [Odoribacteraceae bacterium]|jgi:hypothetical protein|nr:RagB/SusD family nutrient uptake outer membrane protein [Odoribacteraceae bacterium]